MTRHVSGFSSAASGIWRMLAESAPSRVPVTGEREAGMFTNYDELARLKIEEHEAYARKTDLQRHARAAREHSQPAKLHGGRFHSLKVVTTPITFVVVTASQALRAIAR
jgi:hypothetical protein